MSEEVELEETCCEDPHPEVDDVIQHSPFSTTWIGFCGNCNSNIQITYKAEAISKLEAE